MEDDLEALWSRLSLTEEESEGVLVDREKDVDGGEEALTLIGKVLISKPVNVTGFADALKRVWRLQCSVMIRPLGENTFVFKFRNMKDKRKVVDGSPWAFDRNMIAFQEYDPTASLSDLDFSFVGSKRDMVGEKEGEGEAEVNSGLVTQNKVSEVEVFPAVKVMPAVTEVMSSDMQGKEVLGGERRIGWKKLARKASGASPAISPNSGLKRKVVGNTYDGVQMGVNRQGVAQKLKLMAYERGDDSEAARTEAQSR
ncbi:hypothetical protein RIF29_31909 [Crotalaria pallida]|uniref:DUF4283 domain-containing protein n=1 Tax=Crotalaria pallida TaxID=3830 RepID=A0AAN9I251_CROPI